MEAYWKIEINLDLMNKLQNIWKRYPLSQICTALAPTHNDQVNNVLDPIEELNCFH